MDEGVINKFLSVTLTEEEDVILDFGNDDIVEGLVECEKSVFVKVLADKTVNSMALRNTMAYVWDNKE